MRHRLRTELAEDAAGQPGAASDVDVADAVVLALINSGAAVARSSRRREVVVPGRSLTKGAPRR